MVIKAIDTFPEIDIPLDEKRFFQDHVYPLVLAKGDYFVSKNSVCDKIGFINSGQMRSVIAAENHEIILSQHVENQFVSAFTSILTGQPSTRCIYALDPTRLTIIPGSFLLQLLERHHCWVDFWLRVLARQVPDLDEKTKHFLTKTKRGKNAKR